MQVARLRSYPERSGSIVRTEGTPMDSRHLRALVEKMQGRVVRASASDASADDKQALTLAWDSLVEHLALGAMPETRACPCCGKEVMLTATVCGYCWSKLALVGAASEEARRAR